jgi:hypothetical protein
LWANGQFLNALTLSDTVIAIPSLASSIDSLTFNKFTINHCCCTQYFNKTVTVTDTTITLFASYDDQKCRCDCFMAGSNTTFSCGPIKPGTYKIYVKEDIYCPTAVCITVETVNRPLPWGKITVKEGSPTQLFDEKSTKSKSVHSQLWYSSVEKKLIFNLLKAQYVIVTAYVVNGEKSTELSSKKYLAAGTHSFRMDQQRFKSGVVIIHVKGEDFSEVRMINLTKQ